ncbi:MAG: membrane protein insertase YidC [Cyanobacteria bacterium]|nr:membrane protein insertase YidC [Cyanobacteriota bacterium]MDW8200838.1 membrane protein insertase YidC [Cyanobacteriota bacterium SKYGB_h_bin112]
MDFGVSFLSSNVMLPILDFFYGVVPSYGLAIVALTLVVRLAVYPLSAGSIRSMRRMKVAQPVMKQRQEEIQRKYKDNPAKQQEELSKLFQEFGNPLSGCLPILLQMPVLFALFATLRGSPFADVSYNVNVQVLPKEQMEQIVPQAFATPPQNIYLSVGVHPPVSAVMPSGTKLAVGEQSKVLFQTVEGKPLSDLLQAYPNPELTPQWTVTKGEGVVSVTEDGTITAIAPGEATLQGKIPGLAANKGFLFIEALGRVGAFDPDGTIHWDVVVMILGFGISLYINQLLTGQGSSSDNPQQDTVNKITPVLFSGMFLFFPLPAGVLMYMLIANIFQTGQTFLLLREPLPENLQKIVDAQAAATTINVEATSSSPKATNTGSSKTTTTGGRSALPFEPGRSSKKKA